MRKTSLKIINFPCFKFSLTASVIFFCLIKIKIEKKYLLNKSLFQNKAKKKEEKRKYLLFLIYKLLAKYLLIRV